MEILVLVVGTWLLASWLLGPILGRRALGSGTGFLVRLIVGTASSIVTTSARALAFGVNALSFGWLRISIPSGSSQAVLAPGDAPPAADRYGDYLDYRGVAVEGEIRALRQPGGVSLGRFCHPRGRRGGELWLSPQMLHRNTAIIGPPGSGKTEGLILPWIVQLLQAGQSVVTVDVKGDLRDRLSAETNRLGCRLWYWNCSDPARSSSWNWLDGVRDHRDVEAATQSIIGRPNPNDSQPFFYQRDYRWLRCLVSLVKEVHGKQARPRDLYNVVSDQAALCDLFRRNPKIQGAASEVADLLQFSVDEHSRAVSGLLNALHLFNTPHVVQTTERSDFILPSICVQPTLLVIGAPLADARAAEILSSLMLNQLFTFVYRRFAPGGTGTPLSLYFILDEAARLKDRIQYEEVLSIARSAGVGICLAAQDVSQFGDDRAISAILTNCLTFITLRGCSPQTAKYLSARLGQRPERFVSVNQQRGAFNIFGQYGSNTNVTTVPVLGEREIMHPPQGQYCAIAQVSPVCSKPFVIDLAKS